MAVARLTAALAVLALPLLAGCSDDEAPPAAERPVADNPVVEDPGPVHVHGLGVNPSDGALFLATHTGLFRLPEGENKQAERVAGRYQDTMAFTIVGPDRFLGSGHPDGREDLPPYLGLIESRDAGAGWRPISLLGKVDFHVLEIAGKTVYGFGSDFESRAPTFLASDDRGRTWAERAAPEPLLALAINPLDSRRIVASGDSVNVSGDGGRTWRTVGAKPGLLAWPSPKRLYSVDERGVVAVSATGGRSWQATGSLGGAPAAFESAGSRRLVAALHDGTVKESRNGGMTWQVRFRP
ncbi:MAG: F510_1955 family glycosylhydrolase [Thermoleophilaceae bacterium]